MMKKKMMALGLCAVMTVSSIAGCSGKETAPDASEKAQNSSEETQAPSAPAEITNPKENGLSSIFPLKEKVTLTYYINQNNAMKATMESYADVEFFKELEELTNVHIEWNHNVSDENFALMIAGGELPDMINWNLSKAAGGVQALLDDNVILNLTDLMPQHAPNYYAWMENNSEEDRAYKMDDGSLYQLVNFNSDWENLDIVTFEILGPQIRKDWLNDLGLEMPTTTDELYTVLKAFKEADCNKNGDPDDEVPYVIVGTDKGLTESMYTLAGSFGAINDFQLSADGEVVFGPLTDNFKEFLTYMKKLYSEGLINSDFAVNGDAFNLIFQGQGGFSIGAMGSGVIAAHDLLKTQNPDYDYVSVPWLTGPRGDQYKTVGSTAAPRATAITTSCKNPEIALAWLDYVYSYAGSMSSTFGIEGKSYDFVDGYPTINEEVKKNDSGWSEEQSIARWMLGPINYPNARDYRFYEQVNLNEDYKMEIQDNWRKAKEEIILPPVGLTTEESSIYSGIMADITTYVSECNLKFIVGQMDLEKDWDGYVENVKKMKLEEARACKDAAYIRYQNR